MKKLESYFLAIIFGFGGLSSQAQNIYGEYRIWIDVQGDGGSHITQIWFDDESTWGDPNFPPTYGWDACCDSEMLFGNSNNPHVYTQVVEPPEPPNSSRLSTNGLPLLYEHTPVPMGFYVGNGLAQYTFTFSQLYTLPSDVTVELEDLSLNVTQDLLGDSVYTTWGAPNDDEERFIIHINPLITKIENNPTDQELISITVLNNMINVISEHEKDVQLRLVDSNGKQIMDRRMMNSNKLEVSIQNLPKGVYIVSVMSKTGQGKHMKVLR